MRKSPVDVDELVANYQAGASLRELCRKYRADRTTLTRHLRKRGVPIRTHTHQRLIGPHAEPSRHRYDESEVVACYKAGATHVEMFEIFHLCYDTLCKILERNGLQTRSISEGKRAQQLRVPLEARKNHAKKMTAGMKAWLAAGGKRKSPGFRKPRRRTEES